MFVSVSGVSESEKGNGVEREEEEDEFSPVVVEDSSSYLEQLDKELSHLVCHLRYKYCMHVM